MRQMSEMHPSLLFYLHAKMNTSTMTLFTLHYAGGSEDRPSAVSISVQMQKFCCHAPAASTHIHSCAMLLLLHCAVAYSVCSILPISSDPANCVSVHHDDCVPAVGLCMYLPSRRGLLVLRCRLSVVSRWVRVYRCPMSCSCRRSSRKKILGVFRGVIGMLKLC